MPPSPSVGPMYTKPGNVRTQPVETSAPVDGISTALLGRTSQNDVRVVEFGYGPTKPPHRYQAASSEAYCFKPFPGQGAMAPQKRTEPPPFFSRHPTRMWLPQPRDRVLPGYGNMGPDPTLEQPEYSMMRYSVSAPSLDVPRQWTSARCVHGEQVSYANTGDKQGREKQRLAMAQLRGKQQVAPQLMEIEGVTSVPNSSRSAFGAKRSAGPGGPTTVSMPLVTGHLVPPGAKAGLPTWRCQAGK